uniref:Sushi domain-containing protein n=1 Tax=Macaca fascicularis TaxID=9541 RepID=A0A2K5WCF5_MACFA
MSDLGAVISLLLRGRQLFALYSGNDVTDIPDDGCPKPPMIANGYVEHSVRYQCKNYYRLRTGDGVYTLNNEKQWTNKAVGDKLPECEAVCGKPKNPADAVQRILGGYLVCGWDPKL